MTGWIVVLIVAVLAALATMPFVQELRRRPPEAAHAPGRFAELSRGRTHYQWLGGARGPVAVCVHGLTTPSQVWSDYARELSDLGYRVLVYDLYGRGFSDAVPGRQDAEFFVEQLHELLQDQGLKDDLTLVGYSMGGAIATAFTARRPDRILRLVVIAPSGIAETPEPFHARLIALGRFGTWLHALIEPWRLRAALLREKAAGVAPLFDVRMAQLRRSGYIPALLSSRRGLLQARQEQEHRAISRADIPVFAFWGEADEVIPLRGLGTLAQWNRTARQEVVPGADHRLIMTHAPVLADRYRAIVRGD